MKILRQSAIIAAVCAVAELIKYLLPLPIPASVYGLILMLLALLTGLIKPEQISTVADFFISIMPVLFIAPTVALITQPEHRAGGAAGHSGHYAGHRHQRQGRPGGGPAGSQTAGG